MKNFLMLIAICTFTLAQAQMTATFNTTENTQCDGSDCEYSGPTIMINEIMISPTVGDGSLSGTDASARGEWIELYNPNICEPIDISCYFLGSAAKQGGLFGGPKGEGFKLPDNLIVPAGGFCIVRGENAVPVDPALLFANGGNTLEVVVPASLSGNGICIDASSPTRLWFPNAGGWFAFYDENGVVQDAISWASQDGIDVAPCVPTNNTCGTIVSSLSNYNAIPIDRKEKIFNGAVTGSWGKSIRRLPDGGLWAKNQGDVPTEGDCNGICAQLSASTCDGEATVTIANGSGDYTYVWDDSEGQLTQTATGLCEGTYTVEVTDQISGDVQTFTIDVEDFVPDVNLDINEELCNYGQTVSMDDISTYSPLPGAGQTGVFTGTGIVGSDFDASVSGDGTFPITYTFTDENACHNNSDIADLIVHETPDAQISGIAPEYCMADSTVILTLSPAGGILSGPGISNGEFNLIAAGIGTHTIKYAVENQYGCKDSVIVTVIVNALPTFDLAISNPNCGETDGEIIMTPNAGDSPYDFSIDGGDNTQTNGTFSNLIAGFYELVVSDNNGCIVSIDTTLTTTGLKDASFTFSSFCEGDNNGATDIVDPNGEFSFVPPAGDSATIDITTGVISNGVGGTTYTVQHVVEGLCPDTVLVDVSVYTYPIVSLDADTTQGIPPLVVNFTNNSSGADNYNWDFGDGLGQQNNNDNVPHIFIDEGTFITILTGESGNGLCIDTAMIKIITAYPPIEYTFPNVFTPNDDNSNDNFNFVHYKNVKNLHILILNRWGNPIFESDEINFHWNGKVNNSGAECVDGTYFYKAILHDYAGKEYKEHGFLQLNRGE